MPAEGKKGTLMGMLTPGRRKFWKKILKHMKEVTQDSKLAGGLAAKYTPMKWLYVFHLFWLLPSFLQGLGHSTCSWPMQCFTLAKVKIKQKVLFESTKFSQLSEWRRSSWEEHLSPREGLDNAVQQARLPRQSCTALNSSRKLNASLNEVQLMG